LPPGAIKTILSFLAAMALASCGEKTTRADPEGHRAYTNETPQHPVYERTLMQGERSERTGS
jgi:hypothetical protein